MRTVAFAVAAVITACAAGAAAQDRPAAYTNAEACLEANVDAALAASSGAADAADFLIGYLCAGPVATALKYQVNSDLLASGKGMIAGFGAIGASAGTGESLGDMPDFDSMSDEEIDAWLKEQEASATANASEDVAPFGETGSTPPADPFEGIYVDPVTGDLVTGDAAMGPVIVGVIDYLNAAARIMTDSPPTFLREHAARLIVQRRGR